MIALETFKKVTLSFISLVIFYSACIFAQSENTAEPALQLSFPQSTSTFDARTQLLTVPSVTVIQNEGSSCYSVIMSADSAFKFSLHKATPISCSVNQQIISMVGFYKGTSNGSYFGNDSVDIAVTVNEATVLIIASEFFDGECRYTGTIESDGYSISNGMYQCSDFTSGTWTMNQIKTVDFNDIYISLNSSGRGLKRMYGHR